jgi:hypothetical protein
MARAGTSKRPLPHELSRQQSLDALAIGDVTALRLLHGGQE